MSQLDLIEGVRSHVVNVASVPKRSPFRYPGGKTWLVPRIRRWLGEAQSSLLIEPFLGGGIVSLTAVLEGLVDHAILCELDDAIAAVWETMLNGDGKWLADQIVAYDLTEENLKETLSRSATSRREQAFQTILRNRCYRGGILAEGSGLMKGGENGRGIQSRWYPGTLSKRILVIHENRFRFTFIHGDAFKIMEAHQDDPQCAIFIDPPYVKAARRLYTCHQVDHEGLFDLATSLRGNVLMTYDNDPIVRSLATSRGFDMRAISMKNAHHAQQTELLIAKDLSWV